MNNISINEISDNTIFSEDSYILENLFFLPKNLPVHQYHIKLLREWNIPSVQTEGILAGEAMNQIVKEELKEAGKPESVSREEAALNVLVDNEKSAVSDIKEDKKNALLDSNVKDFVEIYKEWIKTIVIFFNEIIIHRLVDKEKVINFIKDIITHVDKNRNNALLLFGKKFEGIFYVLPQTLETIILSYIIGDGLNLSDLTLSNLLIASLFHDIGMLKVSKLILEKKGALTEEEKRTVRTHTNLGYKFLREAGYSAVIASGALQHHERMDGKGYPGGLASDKITEIAKIISVTDAYCAAIENKPYKNSPVHGKEVIQDLLRAGGTAYSPQILKELIKNISLYPIGSLVVLSDNLPARVVGTSGIAMKPIVKRVAKTGEGEVLDLSKETTLYIKGLYEIKR